MRLPVAPRLLMLSLLRGGLSRMTIAAHIASSDSADEYFTDERCHILELSNSPDDPAVSIARARVEPGVTTKQHRVAGTTERYVILAGAGRVFIDGLDEQTVTEGDVVVIPAGVAQSICNDGDQDLVFLCICNPRFEWSQYESLE
jgi:mannose-6-phosphate isomerase-like protein (cupin superfamily)